ncbi:hypothetical protein AVL48_27165 [Amycolatopsis regifaucium]|uniref:Uncharacterized protein n=1 Tax=Amycolatopsis regifaucium TaxID=546365 RepID=A0A154MR24_9PSEU|nr:hypothetical protein AVL48_27165 [Amycolatopsis regifaucium]
MQKAEQALRHLSKDCAYGTCVCGVQVREHPGHLGPQRGQQWQLERFQHGHVETGLPGRRRDFETDPPGADHGEPGPRRQYLPQALGVAEAAQRERVLPAR